MFIGSATNGHLHRCIADPLRLIWEKRLFARPRDAVLIASSDQIHLRCRCGPMRAGIASMVQWDTCDVLIRELWDVQRKALHSASGPLRLLQDPTLHLAGFALPLCLADLGAIGIRTRTGLWCQTYQAGWPTTAPFLVPAGRSGTGLMIAAALPARWFTGLPFTAASIESTIPDAARQHVAVVWHEASQVIHPCTRSADCILEPNNIARWL